jgi:type III pantothenate kinase
VSVLLVDIGNSRIKWAVWSAGRLGRQRAATYGDWNARDFARALFTRPARLERILVASVAGRQVDRRFASAARRAAGIRPTFLNTVRRAGGVTTRYAEPWKLGVDRFAAVIGARSISGARAACVIDIGTAMTIDLVDARGVHRGGVIIPGPELMMASLLRQTSGIRSRAYGRAMGRAFFARSTLAAIGHGARFAAAAAIDRAVSEAHRELGSAPRVFLTGGAASEVQHLLRSRHLSVPDLVLRGLAVLA